MHLGCSRVQVHQHTLKIKDEQPITGGFKDASVLSLTFHQCCLSSLTLGDVLSKLYIDGGNFSGSLANGLGQASLTVDREVGQACHQADDDQPGHLEDAQWTSCRSLPALRWCRGQFPGLVRKADNRQDRAALENMLWPAKDLRAVAHGEIEAAELLTQPRFFQHRWHVQQHIDQTPVGISLVDGLPGNEALVAWDQL